jgi:hypothetical protein
MRTQLTMQVEGPFSLAAAASFGFGPSTGRPFPDARLLRLAFVADDLRHHVGVVLTQQADGSLVADISGSHSGQACGAGPPLCCLTWNGLVPRCVVPTT